MSFTENPYKHMGIITNNDGETFGWECSSCGKEWPYFHPQAPINRIRNDFLYHVRTSHNLNEGDCRDWS
jgi:hypothetical protein